MLVLLRRVYETVVIANDITITILGREGNQVRLGITAPKDVSIYREELYRRIQEGNIEEDDLGW